jgi:hypothetical protein
MPNIGMRCERYAPWHCQYDQAMSPSLCGKDDDVLLMLSVVQGLLQRFCKDCERTMCTAAGVQPVFGVNCWVVVAGVVLFHARSAFVG